MGEWLDNVAAKVSVLGENVAWAGVGFIAGLLATWVIVMDGTKLERAAYNIYMAGKWTCINGDVDEAALWTALRDSVSALRRGTQRQRGCMTETTRSTRNSTAKQNIQATG